MSEPLVVPIADLRAVFDAVISHVEEQSGEAITLTDDYFWWISSPDVYDVYAQPDADALTIGQLSEAWEFVSAGVRSDQVVSRSAVWLSQVLRAVGETATG